MMRTTDTTERRMETPTPGYVWNVILLNDISVGLSVEEKAKPPIPANPISPSRFLMYNTRIRGKSQKQLN